MVNSFSTALKAFKAKHYDVTIEILKRLQKDEMSVEANHLLVKALFLNHDYSNAQKYVQEMINTYATNQNDFKLLVQIWLKNHSFIQLRMILQSVNDESFRLELLKQVNQKELWVQEHKQDSLKKLEGSLYHLASHGLSMQRRILKRSYLLPLDNFISAVKFALKDPFINPIMRSELLNNLLHLGYSGEIDIYCIDNEIHGVDLKNLHFLNQMNSYRNIMEIIKTKYGDSDNFKMRYLINTFNIYLLYMYPLNDKLIHDYDKWVQIAVKSLQGPVKPNNYVENKIITFQKKLNQITNEISLK